MQARTLLFVNGRGDGVSVPPALDGILQKELRPGEAVVWDCPNGWHNPWLNYPMAFVFAIASIVALKLTWLSYPSVEAYCFGSTSRKCDETYHTTFPFLLFLSIFGLYISIRDSLRKRRVEEGRNHSHIVITNERFMHIFDWSREEVRFIAYKNLNRVPTRTGIVFSKPKRGIYMWLYPRVYTYELPKEKILEAIEVMNEQEMTTK